MKKIINTFALLFFFASFSYGQLGFRAGLNISNQSYSTTSNSTFEASGKIGYLVGVNYKLGLANLVAVRGGVEYALKGAKIDLNGGESNANFEYVEVPIDFIYQSGSFSVYTGPYFAFLTSAENGLQNLKPDMKSMDVGLNVGLEFSIASFGFGAKYGLGLSDISDFEVSSDETIKNNVLSIYATFTL